jgi:glycerol uptake facilitator protein
MESVVAQALVSEMLGTAMLICIGAAINANLALPKTKGRPAPGTGPNWTLISLGWGFAVFTGVYVAFRSGAHLNPAVTVGLLVAGEPFYTSEAGQVIIAGSVPVALGYIAAQVVGCFIGACTAWLAFKKHFDLAGGVRHSQASRGAQPSEAQGDNLGIGAEGILGIFATGPAIRSYQWNLATEAIGTFVLVFWVLVNGPTPEKLGPLAVALVVVAIGAGLGGPTGYAINPARDLGPRIAHAMLPIGGKGGSDWAYAWVPVVGPLIGGALAGWAGAAWLAV